jgi:hypothetical protein
VAPEKRRFVRESVLLYAALRRSRRNTPRPTSAVPSGAKEAGSGNGGGGGEESVALMENDLEVPTIDSVSDIISLIVFPLNGARTPNGVKGSLKKIVMLWLVALDVSAVITPNVALKLLTADVHA